MSNSKLSQHPVPVEIEESVEDDSSQHQLELFDSSFFRQQPSQSHRRRWGWLLGTILLVGGVGLGMRSWQFSRASSAPPGAAKPPPAAVKLATVATNTVQDSAVFVGTLEAPRFVSIKPQIEGRVKQL